MKNNLIIFLFLPLLSFGQDIEGKWYGPNGLIELIFQNTNHYIINVIDKPDPETGEWHIDGNALIFGKDTAIISKDQIVFMKHSFVRSINYWEGNIESLLLIGRYSTEWMYNDVIHQDTTEFSESGKYKLTSSEDEGTWKLKEFNNRYYLYMEDRFGDDKPLLIKKWDIDSLIVQYYDSREYKYHLSKWKKLN